MASEDGPQVCDCPTEEDIRRWGREVRAEIESGIASPELLQAAEDALNRWAMAPLPAPWGAVVKAAPKARIVAIGGKRVRASAPPHRSHAHA